MPPAGEQVGARIPRQVSPSQPRRILTDSQMDLRGSQSLPGGGAPRDSLPHIVSHHISLPHLPRALFSPPRCPSWRNAAGQQVWASSSCQDDGTWSSPQSAPPGQLRYPPELPRPGKDDLACHCPPLNLTYNPNTRESGAEVRTKSFSILEGGRADRKS